MNSEHFRAFLWLRWRIRVNQLRRGGVANAVILIVLAAVVLLLGLVLAISLFFVGLYALAGQPPIALMCTWDVVGGVFLWFWVVGLLTDLQRPESLSLDKFLHLPVSLTGAFLINYLSSLLSVNLIVFVPAMLGLSLGLIFGRGPAMLWQLPLLAAFLLAVTAVTYQLQGWLAALMVNKRRRRTIVVVVTTIIILLGQLPSLINLYRPWQGRRENLSPEPAGQGMEQLGETVRFYNLIMPPGWLPLGIVHAAEGNALPAVLGTLGLTLIGLASLWRSYRTTMRLYTGQFTAGKAAAAATPPPTPKPIQIPRSNPLEKRVPWLSEPATAVALAGFRSLVRAPEAKMMLLGPIIMMVLFGGFFLRGSASGVSVPPPLVAFGAMAMMLICMSQLMGNQFGFDRNGFRVFVLCPANRRDILLGKNLGFAPLVLPLCVVAVVLVQLLYPMPLDWLVAMLPSLLSMYLLFCLVENWLSIAAPVRIAAGSLKPAGSNGRAILLHLLGMVMLLSILMPVLLPLGAEYLLVWLGWPRGIPLFLILSALECVAVVYLYRWVVAWQGRALQSSEKRILKTVTTKVE
jgi:hypothetical protein